MTDWLLPIALGLMAGGSVFLIVYALLARPQGSVRRQQETILPGIQVRLDKAQLGVGATTYITRSVTTGLAFGLLMALATGAWLTLPVGLIAGFAFVWSRLEDERNEALNNYHKALASAAHTIVNSWRVRPSMNRALEAVATYGRGEVAADFGNARRDLQGGSSLAEAFQRVADRRQSPVFDALATALIVSEESSGEVTEMLSRQAESTRQMAVIYEETMDEQRGQRADVMWGVIGPWVVLALIRVATLFSSGGIGYGTDFFTTIPGQIAAVVAAVLTVVAYIHSRRTAAQGMIVERVELERGKGESPEAEEGQPLPSLSYR